MNITGFLVMDTDGVEIDADAYQNSLAFNCPLCEYPVVAVTLRKQRGCDEWHPAVCKGCGEGYFLDVRERAEKLYIHVA